MLRWGRARRRREPGAASSRAPLASTAPRWAPRSSCKSSGARWCSAWSTWQVRACVHAVGHGARATPRPAAPAGASSATSPLPPPGASQPTPPPADFDGSLPRGAIRSLLPPDLRDAPPRRLAEARLPLNFRLVVAVNKADLLPKQVTPARLEVSAPGWAVVWRSAAAACSPRLRVWGCAVLSCGCAPRWPPPPPAHWLALKQHLPCAARLPLRSAGCASAWRRAACPAPPPCTSSAAPRAAACASCWRTCRRRWACAETCGWWARR